MAGTGAGSGRRATIWQVAEAAGVSHQTVSRYLRADSGMKPQTREKVRAAIEELGYRPNLSARSMRTRRSNRIGVLLPSDSAFQASALSGALDIATTEGYAIEVFAVDGDARAAFERVLQIADSGQVDGILALAPLPPDTEHSYPGRAAIVASADYDERTRSMGAMADGSPIGEIVEGLHDLGHRRLMHVTGDLEFASARNRRAAFVEATTRLGIDAALVHTGTWSEEAGHEAVRTIAAMPREERPTAIVAASDLVAVGVINGAREQGWRIPEDLSVSGWDAHYLGGVLQPALTTVKDDRRQLGRNAMSRLLAALRDEPLPAEEVLSTVIWRDSTGKAPA